MVLVSNFRWSAPLFFISHVLGFSPLVLHSKPSALLFSSPIGVSQKCGIQFYPGFFEPVVPNIRLTRSRDGTNGVAYFEFDRPSMFDAKATIEETTQEAIASMRMIDDEGEITTTDISAKFVNGQPSALSVSFVMKSSEEWDRFIRFMDRYAESNELGFAGGGDGGGGTATKASPKSMEI
mmetsp:Transcript_45244/g.91306  ORF Transcript_45244/g.91306 Transcript_45244/m.91306 type:complete len:180 (+) Transcript_45244:92-631(+)